jgi:hypothetical protein
VKLDQAIGTWDYAITNSDCQNVIKYFEKMNSMGMAISRQDEGESALIKKDRAVFLSPSMLINSIDDSFWTPILSKVWECYLEYVSHYEILKKYDSNRIVSFKIQKTVEEEGYHVWHSENMSVNCSRRLLAWAVYLNTVNQGGETEFLHQRLRVEAITGRVVMWPATFTHVHRGNPPLSGEKYLLTGWIELA